MRSCFLALTISLVAWTSSTSRADTPADKAKADAEVLFREAVALRNAGELEKACAKFNDALGRDEHAVGAMLNVALCDEKLDRVASAFRRFTDAQTQARTQGLTEHEQAATEHLATLAPLVPFVKLTFAETLPGMKVLVDDQVISDKELASEVPVDPGSRTILVTAPGRLPYTKTVLLAKSQHLAVDVPQLARSVTVKSSRRTIGKIVSISGVAAVGIGIALGTYASHQWHLAVHSTTTDPVTGQPIPNCKPAGDNYICDPQTHTKTETDFTLGKVGTAVGVVGLVAVGVGAYLWLRAPSEGDKPEGRVSVVPTLGPGEVGLTALGRF